MAGQMDAVQSSDTVVVMQQDIGIYRLTHHNKKGDPGPARDYLLGAAL